jgi:Flp pilus assembly pilin Flp
MEFFNVRIHQRKDETGQATVEFALLLPLFVTCIGVLIATTMLALSTLRLADTARTAARVASTSNDPQDAVRTLTTKTGVESRVTLDDQRQFLTVYLTQRIRLPLIGLPIPVVRITSHTTVMYEGVPMLLG